MKAVGRASVEKAIHRSVIFIERAKKPNTWLTGAGSRRLEGTDIGHKNAEGMAYVGVRVEPPVRLGRVVEGGFG